MKKEEITQLKAIQDKVDGLKRSINDLYENVGLSGNRSLSIYLPQSGERHKLYTSNVPDLTDNLIDFLLNAYKDHLAELEEQLNSLVLCKENGPKAYYTPVEII